MSRGQPAAAAARTFDIGDFPLRVASAAASAAVSDFYTMTMTTADKDRERERRRQEGRTVEGEGGREDSEEGRLIFAPGPFLHSGE